MAIETPPQNKNDEARFDNILDSVKAELTKSKIEALKAKVKEKVKLLEEHQRAASQITVEIEKMIEDAKKGIL